MLKAALEIFLMTSRLNRDSKTVLSLSMSRIKRTIEIRTYELPLEELPTDIRAMLTTEEVAAYSKGAAYFIELAHKNLDLEQINKYYSRNGRTS